MKKISVTSGLVLAVFLSSCAPSMDGYSRGFFASPVGEDGYYVSYGSNGLSSAQYSQIYWLYNCAKLTLMRGYDGFHFESDIKMSDDIDYGLIQQGGGYGTIFAAGLVFGAVASEIGRAHV